jgi:uncharacterized membrane protein YciS (DUF1049 family)
LETNNGTVLWEAKADYRLKNLLALLYLAGFFLALGI